MQDVQKKSRTSSGCLTYHEFTTFAWRVQLPSSWRWNHTLFRIHSERDFLMSYYFFSRCIAFSTYTNSVHVWALLQEGQISMKFVIDTDHHFSECFQFSTRFAVDLNTNNKHSWRNCSWKFLLPARLFIVRNSLLL